jgi:2-succinyl-5-enolpyruvyl-6-hydroxy-3-cyclohexene-1-carboxylate synthase
MPAENAGRAFAVVFVDELVRQGMRHAVIAPGSRSTPIALALLENSDVSVHVRIDERSAAYLALGIAKATGDVVPVLCTSGTAATHFHGAVMEADLSRVPLLVLTADRPPELHGIGANQTVEQAGMYGVAVRWAPDVPVPETREDAVDQWRALVVEAAAHCHGTRGLPPGPVHLNLPFREPLIPVDDGLGFGFPYDLGRRPAPFDDAGGSADQSTQVFDRLNGVDRGVIVAGAGSDDVSVGLLADQTGWPVIAEPHSNSRHGDDAVRATDALLRDSTFTTRHRPDLVVVVGRVGLSRALLSWLGTVDHVIVSLDGGNWDVTGTAQAVLHCTPSEFAAMAAKLPASSPEWAAQWVAAAHGAATELDATLDATDVLTEPRVARDVADLVPEGATLVVASSMPIRDLDLVMRPRAGVRIYANRGVSGIDGFVSTAQGVAIGQGNDAPTVALCGDLSLLHDVNGLMPGPDSRPDITYVVINNDGGGIFSLLPQSSSVEPAAFERLFGTPHGMSLEKVAAAYDVDHTLATTAEELATALSSYGGVRMIEVRTDRSENAALHERLRGIRPGNTS